MTFRFPPHKDQDSSETSICHQYIGGPTYPIKLLILSPFNIKSYNVQNIEERNTVKIICHIAHVPVRRFPEQ